MSECKWYIVKFMRDMRRREPRNVGIVVRQEGRWASRFFGEDPKTGQIDGRTLRSIGATADVYRSWAEYYRRKSTDLGWPDVDRLQRQRPHSFFVENGGVLLGAHDDLGLTLEQLFVELVGEPHHRETPADALRESVDEIFQRAHIVPTESPTVEARWEHGAELTEVSFDFGYTNGQLHLMDRLNAGAPNASMAARDFWARAQAARLGAGVQSFVVFYSSSSARDNRHLDEVLRPVENQAHAIDVDRPDAALEEISALLAH